MLYDANLLYLTRRLATIATGAATLQAPHNSACSAASLSSKRGSNPFADTDPSPASAWPAAKSSMLFDANLLYLTRRLATIATGAATLQAPRASSFPDSPVS